MVHKELDNELKKIAPVPIIIDSSTRNEPIPVNPGPSSFLKKLLKYLFNIQRYSAYAFSSFLGIHVSSVIVSPGIGIPLNITQDVFEMGRAVYTLPYFENIVIFGSAAVHIISGISIRLINNKLKRDRGVALSSKLPYEPIIKNDDRDDIGLGGISGLLGLGYKKSWISTKFPQLTPLSFSGYCLIPLILYHFLKFRYLPILVDGDSSLITINYISYYLNYSLLSNVGKLFNCFALIALIWTTMYHWVSGTLKLTRKITIKYKKLGYAITSGISLLGLISLFRFKRASLEPYGFLGKQYIKYLSSFFI